MAMLLKNARVIDPQVELDCVCDVLVEDGKIAQVGEGIAAEGAEVKRPYGQGTRARPCRHACASARTRL